MRALLVVLALLLALGVAADRIAVAYAEDRLGGELAERGGLQGDPEVDITGFPFLTQAFAGRYDDIRIELTADELGQPEGSSAEVQLHGVQVPLSDALGGSVQQVPVERIDGTATLSYGLLSAQLGPDTTLRPEDGGRLRITHTVELVGQQIPLTATGRVTLDGSDVVVNVEQVAGAGVEVPDWLLDQATDLLDLRYTVPPLPLGLRLTAVEPGADGVVVTVAAEGVVLGG